MYYFFSAQTESKTKQKKIRYEDRYLPVNDVRKTQKIFHIYDDGRGDVFTLWANQGL